MDACEHEFNEWENMGWYRQRVCVRCGVLDVDSIEPDYPDDLIEPDYPDDSEVDVLYGEALLKKTWPDAVEIRHEGECDICHRDTLLTFRLPQFEREERVDRDGQTREECGYFCPACDFSNAGSRVVVDP